MGMTRKEIRKVLKKWVYVNHAGYNYLKHTFIDVGIFKTKMNKEFESLVDEVYKMGLMQNKELVKVLTPFAEVGASVEGNEFNMLYENCEASISMSDLKKAQEVLGLRKKSKW